MRARPKVPNSPDTQFYAVACEKRSYVISAEIFSFIHSFTLLQLFYTIDFMLVGEIERRLLMYFARLQCNEVFDQDHKLLKVA